MQTLKSCDDLTFHEYEEAETKGKLLVVAEFKKVLTLYLGSVLSNDAAMVDKAMRRVSS